jgi:hypothetical protein
MKTKIIFTMLGVLLLAGGLAQAGYVDINENTTINDNIPTDSIVRVHNSVHVTVEATSYVTFQLLDTSVATVYGGNASYELYGSSILKLHGGDFATRSPDVWFGSNSVKIYIYGTNFAFQPAINDGFLSGNWLDQNAAPFNIYLRNLPVPFDQTLGTNIFLVPESITMILMLGGIFGIRKFTR